ncbi:Uncharacterized protein, UPF0303 family [Paenibacillus algorifonticola]|uniref:Uncharacterized protein, UPF0303 family n=1 Tax=Paenibacillus algorifonticola TaxID=684063 RepID=A0A1I2J1G7_9BACL|nr:heme-degrading domain-containing protein [Paenibacillus algorifonticola]SFF47087.1 Uncharacterized protein, UPF0303 family [Paenibacillus algorifonticola]
MNDEMIAKQEMLLQFDKFSHDMGIEIGLLLLSKARSEGKSIAVDISKCGQQIFHAALEGTTVDNDEWLRKKKNTVYRLNQSTLGIQLKLKKQGVTLEEALHLSPVDYVAAGGGFPIKVRGVGFIGAIAVTGTSEVDEHELITSCLSTYLGVSDYPKLMA